MEEFDVGFDIEEIAEVLEREDVNSSDISNGRMDRWKSALLVYKTAPIFGTSLRNYSEYAKDNCDDCCANWNNNRCHAHIKICFLVCKSANRESCYNSTIVWE